MNRKQLTWTAAVVLILLAVYFTFIRVSEVKYDVLISLIGLWLIEGQAG